MQILRFKKKLTFDSHKNVISNEDHGAYHDTYIKAHTTIYMNVDSDLLISPIFKYVRLILLDRVTNLNQLQFRCNDTFIF